MQRVLIIGRQNVVEKNDVKQMAALLGDAELAVHYGYLEECVFTIADKVNVTAQVGGEAADVASYDLVILMGWSSTRVLSDVAHTIALYLESKGVACWNSELVHARSMTKLSQLYRAKRAGALVPNSVFSLDHTLLAQAAQRIIKTDKVICKDIEASRGRRNELTTKAELAPLLVNYQAYPMVAQDFIENDGSDLRVVVAGGRAVLIIQRRGADGTHLTNTSQGGHALKISLDDIPQAVQDQTVALSKEFNREICGIDYMVNTTTMQYTFLEINMIPQLVTGAFVDDKIYSLRQAIQGTLGTHKEA